MTFQREASSRPEWAIAIFAKREAATTVSAATSAALKATRANSVIDVLVNGNPTLASQIARLGPTGTLSPASIRVWSIPLGDKAHAWNLYVHEIWPAADTTFFVDGYVFVRADALHRLALALSAAPVALAATGVPSSGYSAASLRSQMVSHGGIHGNLYALKRAAMQELRRRSFRLPLGIYRTDPVLGAALAFGLDPSRHVWEPKKYISVVVEATWTVDYQPWWRRAHAQARRVLRQAQGVIENLAVRHFFSRERRPPERLPPTVNDLASEWQRLCPAEARRLLWAHPLAWLVAHKLSKPKDWSGATEPAVLLSPPRNPPG